MYKKIACLFLIIAISSCSQFIYSPNTSQGFIPNSEAISHINQGMTPEQVVAILGEPTIKNAFYPNKWSYVEVTDLGNNDIKTKTLALTFEGGKLAKIVKPT